MSEPTDAPPEVPDETVAAPDAIPNDAPVDETVLDDGEILDDNNFGLYSEGEVEADVGPVKAATEKNLPDEDVAIDVANTDNAVEADTSSVISAHEVDADVDTDAIDESDTNEPKTAENAVEVEASGAPPPPNEETEPGTPSVQPAAEAPEDVPQPDAAQEDAIATVKELPTVDAPADAQSQSAFTAVESPSAPLDPGYEAGDVGNTDDLEDADAQDDKADIDVDEPAADREPTDAEPTHAESPDLPYIADIAMMDTGEPGEIQPSAPAPSSFSTSLQAPATAAADGGEQEPTEVDNDGSGIDFDKMIDAISAEAPEPSAFKATATPPIGAPTGPSNPFPRPPTGPARLTGRFANNTLPHGPSAGVPGTSQATPAATGRRGQAARGSQGQNAAAPRQENNARGEKAAVDRAYQAFLAEEKIHVGENNWEAFPEGSRMFVGNLSQERVSKRDVFERFHRYGRLAQVSIKSAYGFVQFHSAEEAAAAMKDLEGTEIRGRKIHLEISRLQKKDKRHSRDNDSSRDRDRTRGGNDRSPERPKTRGGREGDRYDGRSQDNRRQSKDDHWSGSHGGGHGSPRRDRGGSDSYSRDRNGHDSHGRRSRERSRSPQHRYGNHGDDKGYRSRRSPSPYGRNRSDGGRGGHDALKTRHSNDVPDVQFLVAPGLDREFIKWAQAPFLERGLKTNVLYLTTYMPPRDAIIQVHVLEGVIAVVDLDSRAQATGKIPVQVFNRSVGVKNVRFDGYQDLAPPVAADVVARAKSAAVVQQHRPAYPQAYQAPASYGQPYAPAYQTAAAQAATAAPYTAADIVALFGQLDNATIAQIINALQAQQTQAAPAAASPASYAQAPQAAPYTAPANAPQQAQLAALLSTLGAASMPAPATPPVYGTAPASYPASMPTAAPAAAPYSIPPGVDDQTVQAILAQFAQSRQ
ncbi:nuclear polyadenylated RNA-binding protein 3 [Sporothrix eucalyptigena]|uniref:Nuclear polyadenylated RNA-binding protein 3 n=1 Tax=Sporothrix eucalyptigena TaxID=1812306 RepID=A0ABP0BP21_9PEZI